MKDSNLILDIKNLTVQFHIEDDVIEAVNDISLQLSNGMALDNVVLSSESQYTQMLILQTVDEILAKASIE